MYKYKFSMKFDFAVETNDPQDAKRKYEDLAGEIAEGKICPQDSVASDVTFSVNYNVTPIQEFFIGDKVYPLNGQDEEENFESIYYDDVDPQDYVGIITGINDYEYEVTWVNAKTRIELNVGLKNAWWCGNELTADRAEFLEDYEEYKKDKKEDDYYR